MVNNPKVVILGGGRGLSVIARGLKQFAVDITAVVAVSDDGSSAGRLREEFNIPAVGDIRGVVSALAEDEEYIKQLFEHRFKTTSDLNGHTLGNLILTALIQTEGSVSKAIKMLDNIFKIKGTILPFTEDIVTLRAYMTDGSVFEGESHITEAHRKIERIEYTQEPTISKEVIDAIYDADLIVLGIGSLYTSIIPNLLSKETRKAILESKGKKMYVCNAMTQSGETDDFKVSDCIKTLNRYMKEDFLDAVLVSTTTIPDEVLERYKGLESKSTILVDPILYDEEAFHGKNIEVIAEDLLYITDDGFVQHDSIETATAIFNYLLKTKKRERNKKLELKKGE